MKALSPKLRSFRLALTLTVILTLSSTFAPLSAHASASRAPTPAKSADLRALPGWWTATQDSPPPQPDAPANKDDQDRVDPQPQAPSRPSLSATPAPDRPGASLSTAETRAPAAVQSSRALAHVLDAGGELVLYDNGPLVNSQGSGVGGADESIVQTSLGMSALGYPHQTASGNRIADDFTVSAPAGWQVNEIVFYAYQTNAPSSTSPISGVNYVIWDGPPGHPHSNVVFGVTTTNRLVDTEWTNSYRVLEASSGLNDQRPIMANTASAGVHLPPGVYWLDWQSDGDPIYSGPWAPPIAVSGTFTTGNALRYSEAMGWYAVQDSGTNAPQGFPFVIKGSVGTLLSDSFVEAPPKVERGAPVTYTLAIVNAASVSTTDTVLTNVIPSGTSYVPDSLSCSSGTCWYDAADDAVYWTGTVTATPPRRYFAAAGHDGGTLYALDLIKAGQFVSQTWGTVTTCTVPGLSDNVGIDYDAEHGVLYHSDWGGQDIAVTDLDCNLLYTFTCAGPAPVTFNTGVTFIEGSWPPEVWVTDYMSNKTTRCDTGGHVIEVFTNTWAGATIGLVYNPDLDQLRYAHESQPNPTIHDVYRPSFHPLLESFSLSAINPGWPASMDNRNGAGYDDVMGSYFLPNYADDNIVEIDARGHILNAWETSGASNDSDDGSSISHIVDIAVVPPAPQVVTVTFAVATEAARCNDVIANTTQVNAPALLAPIERQVTTRLASHIYASWDLESDDGGFITGSGTISNTWEWGTLFPRPGGPSRAHSGTRLWATNLAGVIPFEPSAHYLTQTLTLPQDPRGLYLQWWDWQRRDSADVGYVYVNTITDTIYTSYMFQPYWGHHVASLSPWAGQTIDLVFYLASGGTGEGGPGWYIDDVSLHAGCPIDWQKEANGSAWAPDLTVTVESSSTLTVVDVVSTALPFNLIETWDPEQLTLVDYSVAPSTGTVSTTGRWRLAPASPFAYKRIDAGYSSVTGNVYVLGGRLADNSTTGRIWAFNPHSGVYTDTGVDLPVPVSNYSIARLTEEDGDEVLVAFGGRPSSGGVTDTVQGYYPASNTAVLFDADPCPSPMNPGDVAVVDNVAYVIGGFDPGAGVFSATYQFDLSAPAGSRWTAGPNLHRARTFIAAAVVDGVIYAMGGDDYDGFSLIPLTITEKLDTAAGTLAWDDAGVADMPLPCDETPAFGFDTAAPHPLAGHVVVAGCGQWPDEIAEALRYDVEQDAWDLAFPDLNAPRRNHAGALVPGVDGPSAMWIWGGRYDLDSNVLDDVEYYPLTQLSWEVLTGTAQALTLTKRFVARPFTPTETVIQESLWRGDGTLFETRPLTVNVKLPAPVWQKDVTVNGEPPGPAPVTLQAGDVIRVTDRVWLTRTRSVTFTLVESWTASLDLTSWDNSTGSATGTAQSLTWAAHSVAPNTWHVITKTFEALPGPWDGYAITETLWVAGADPQLAPVTLAFAPGIQYVYLPLVLRDR